MIRRAALCLSASLILSACGGMPPQVDPGLVERPPAVKEWESELEKSPHDIRLYQRLIQHDFSVGDFPNAKRTALQCVDANPRNADAWLLAAQVHRTLYELSETEAALEQALGFSGNKNPEASLALASFYKEVGKPLEALTSSRRAYRIDPNDSTRDVLIQAELRAGQQPSVLTENPSRFEDHLLHAQASGDLASLNFSSSVQAKDASTLLRLSLLLEDSGDELKAALEGLLAQNEDPNIRFASYFALWQLEIVKESQRPISGPSGSALAFANKLDQIDDRHPMWLIRRYQAALALNDSAELDHTREAMEDLGMKIPDKAIALEDLLLRWRIEDASRLGLAKFAIALISKLKVEESERDAVTLQHVTLLRQSGDHAKARRLLDDRVATSMGALSSSLRYEWFIQRIFDGDAAKVEQELQALAKTDPDAFRVSPQALAWFRALLNYHLKG